jgi:hypothetical protein
MKGRSIVALALVAGGCAGYGPHPLDLSQPGLYRGTLTIKRAGKADQVGDCFISVNAQGDGYAYAGGSNLGLTQFNWFGTGGQFWSPDTFQNGHWQIFNNGASMVGSFKPTDVANATFIAHPFTFSSAGKQAPVASGSYVGMGVLPGDPSAAANPAMGTVDGTGKLQIVSNGTVLSAQVQPDGSIADATFVQNGAVLMFNIQPAATFANGELTLQFYNEVNVLSNMKFQLTRYAN